MPTSHGLLARVTARPDVFGGNGAELADARSFTGGHQG